MTEKRFAEIEDEIGALLHGLDSKKLGEAVVSMGGSRWPKCSTAKGSPGSYWTIAR
jgi:hypothetical protein